MLKIAGSGVFCLAIGYALGLWKADHHACGVADPVRPSGPAVQSRSSDATSGAVRPAISAVADAPAESWSALQNLPRSRDVDARRVEHLRSLAKSNLPAAVALVLQEPNLNLRALLRRTLVEHWVTVAPDDAGAWALSLPGSEWSVAFGDVLRALAARPDDAVRIAATGHARQPERGAEIGQALIGALAEQGHHAEAAQFALDRPDLQASLLVPAFFEWGQYDPAGALRKLDAVVDPAIREEAMRGMLQGWSASNPSELAQFAAELPTPFHRAVALEEALPRWVMLDHAAAGSWMASAAQGPEFDPGRVAIATLPELVARQPETAARWACSITNASLRHDTMEALVREWGRRDPAAAARFVDVEPRLTANEREALRAGLATGQL